MSQDYLLQAIEYYTGKDGVVPNVDYILQDDGEGIYIKEWNIPNTTQPTMEQLLSIASQVAGAYQFLDIKQKAIEEQLKAQAKPVFFLDKYYLDCSDETTDLLIKARLMLEGTSTTDVEIIDYQGVPTML